MNIVITYKKCEVSNKIKFVYLNSKYALNLFSEHGIDFSLDYNSRYCKYLNFASISMWNFGGAFTRESRIDAAKNKSIVYTLLNISKNKNNEDSYIA